VLGADAAGVLGVRHRIGEDVPLRGATAVGEDGAGPRLAQSFDRRVGMLGSGEVVGPVEQRRDPRVERLDRAEQVPYIGVLGTEVAGEAGVQAGHVLAEGPVAGDRPQLRLPGVAVGVDEARHHDRAARVDHRRPFRGLEVGADRGDPLAFDEDVGALEVADLAVEREDGAALDQGAGHQSWVEPAAGVTPSRSAR
jgi:hypothetical protein